MNRLNFALIVMLITAFVPCLSAQDYLSKEWENEIKTSGKYYWSECSDFKEEEAKQCALDELKQVIKDAVDQTGRWNESFDAINFDRLQQQGKIKIMAWVAKDPTVQQGESVEEESGVRQQPEKTPVDTVKKEVAIPQTPILVPVAEQKPIAEPKPIVEPAPVSISVSTLNPALQELKACKDYNCVRHVALTKGFVRGSKRNSPEGFNNPEQCIIAVFTADYKLAALLDAGGDVRVDLLTGEAIQNYQEHYNLETYFLWYLLQKN